MIRKVQSTEFSPEANGINTFSTKIDGEPTQALPLSDSNIAWGIMNS